MGLMDLFSGENGRNAAQWGAQNLQNSQNQVQGDLRNAATQGVGAIQGGNQAAQQTMQQYLPQALAPIDQGYGQGRSDLINSNTGAMGNLAYGLSGGLGSLQSGMTNANSALQSGIVGYNPYTQAGGSAVGMQANAYGLNGPGGNQAATQAFQAGPGYEWARNQALDAVLRKQNAAGMTASGNTLEELTTLGNNLANQEYDKWRTGLSGLTNVGLQGTAGQQQGYTNMANIAQQGGRDAATLYGNYGQNAANLQAQTGGRMADLASREGQAASNLYSGTGTGIAGLQNQGGLAEGQLYSNLGNQLATTGTAFAKGINEAGLGGMMAGQNANANQFNALMGVANLAATAMGGGGGGGGGSMMSSLGSLFGGGGGGGGTGGEMLGGGSVPIKLF
jgi:hypothetical protein